MSNIGTEKCAFPGRNVSNTKIRKTVKEKNFVLYWAACTAFCVIMAGKQIFHNIAHIQYIFPSNV
jgi:hypothetical protein